jgi:hypothetical protein
LNSKLTMTAGAPRLGTSMSASTYFNWPDQWIVDIAKEIIPPEVLPLFNPISFDTSGELLKFSWELKHVFDSGCIVIMGES